MSPRQSPAEIDYPESDGKPMGETDLHRDWMFRIIELLKQRYRGQQVYVSGDLLVYYEEGNPKRFIVPDAFVVKNSDPGRRRIYKLWEEGTPPHAVFETTSRKTRRNDTVTKPQIYARIGVPEYFAYDPTSDYLKPPLCGYRLTERGEYAPIEPSAQGVLHCQQLGIDLLLDGSDLVMLDSATGERLQTAAEAEQTAREAERIARQAAEAERDAELAARQAAEARIRELEAELALQTERARLQAHSDEAPADDER